MSEPKNPLESEVEVQSASSKKAPKPELKASRTLSTHKKKPERAVARVQDQEIPRFNYHFVGERRTDVQSSTT